MKSKKNIYTNITNGTSYIDLSGCSEKKFIGKTISLFSGAGGMDIGLESAGYDTVLCVEIDPDCRETLRTNRPNWPLFGINDAELSRDIRKLSGKDVFEALELGTNEISLIAGGAPCQPFSHIGKKMGAQAPDNGDLFLEYVRLVSEVNPKAIIFENVAGIAHARHQEVVEYMQDQLQGLGYGLSFEVLNAANYGVPQQRKRFIMIGLLGKTPAFPLPTHCKDKRSWTSFCEDLDRLPKYVPKKWISVKQTLKKIPKKNYKRQDCLGMNHSPEMRNRISLIKVGENFKSLPLNRQPNCWKTGKHQGHDTFGRIVPDMPAPTIRTAAYNPTKGRYIHPYEDRGLNTLEMAAFQGFPSDWQFCTKNVKPSMVSIGKQIGNAVPPLLAQALGSALAHQV